MYIRLLHIYYVQRCTPLSWLLKNLENKLRYYLSIIQNMYKSRQITIVIIV